MSRTKRILNAPKKIKEKLKDFNEERKKPKEPITTKASLFSIVSWAFYDLGNTIFSILIVIGSSIYLAFNLSTFPWIGILVAILWATYNLLRKLISVETDIGLFIVDSDGAILDL